MIRVEMQTTSNCLFFLLIVNKLSHVSTCTTAVVTFSETVVRVRTNHVITNYDQLLKQTTKRPIWQ